MRRVAVVGVGLHKYGKFDQSVTDLIGDAVGRALDDAGVSWSQIEAISSASSRSGGRGWGLNGNDIVRTFGQSGVPVYNLSAGCASGANAFHTAYSMVAGGVYDVMLVLGGEKLPKGMIQYAASKEDTDAEYVKQRCVGVTGPNVWALEANRRIAELGTTPETFAQVSVKSRILARDNEYARYRDELTVDGVLASPIISEPLHLYEVCPVSDGAAAAVICAEERLSEMKSSPVWVAGCAVATKLWGDAIPSDVAGFAGQQGLHHSEITGAVAKALLQAGVGVKELDLVELADNSVFHELQVPELLGMCEPGESDSLLVKGQTMPDGRMPINPSGGFLSFGEATMAMGIFQVFEAVHQLRGWSGKRQVPGAKLALTQTMGLGGNAAAIVLKS